MDRSTELRSEVVVCEESLDCVDLERLRTLSLATAGLATLLLRLELVELVVLVCELVITGTGRGAGLMLGRVSLGDRSPLELEELRSRMEVSGLALLVSELGVLELVLEAESLAFINSD